MRSEFYIGESVLALTSPKSDNSQNRVAGKVYKVRSAMKCFYCRRQMIRISDKSAKGNRIQCVCKGVLSNHGYQWTKSSEFCALEDLQERLDYEVALENYGIAIIIRDYLKAQSKKKA